MKYIYQQKDWPQFEWNDEAILDLLSSVRHKQGRLLGKLEGLGFQLQQEASLETLMLDVLKSSEIEGEKLPVDQVRSSIARKLGIEIAGEVISNRNVDGVVEMMLDATQKYQERLTAERLFSWQASLFPTGRSGMQKIKTGIWRDDSTGPMQVVSGALGKEKIHFQAPSYNQVPSFMKEMLKWFYEKSMDPVLKAAVLHLWFLTIHPFDDGNGRVARAITDMQLARADNSKQRFYSMSAQIQKERKDYYKMLETTQKGDLNITKWILWFLNCLDRAITQSEQNLGRVLQKAKFWDVNGSAHLNERQKKMLNKFLDDFEGKLTSSKWAKMNKCSTDTALRDIQDLIDKEILEKEPGGGRSTSYRVRIKSRNAENK